MRYVSIFLFLFLTPVLSADTAIGDWGHFINYTPTSYFHNPEGKPFSIEVHVMQWGIEAWNRDKITLRLVGPGEEVLINGDQPLTGARARLEIGEAKPGVYRLHTQGNVWISSSLDRSVVWTGMPGRHLMDDQARIPVKENSKRLRQPHYYEKEGQLVFQAAVPRRWWFWVPEDTREFTCQAMIADRCMSQREDWGYFIITPRGQRIRALWGQPPHEPQGENYRQDQKVAVEVEPGTAGRFWCLEVSLGDSHQYSNINFSLDGVPPYLARSPEEWFNPETGKPAPIDLYDNTPFFQSAKTEMLKEEWPALQHFSPSPSLGDPDGIEILGDGKYALWNPEGRTLNFRVGTYLPRYGDATPPSRVRITGPDGSVLVEEDMSMKHLHENDGSPTHSLDPGTGVTRVSISEAERWISFTYPAVPTVLIGQERDGWQHFSFTVCAPRNWYFHVPRGTRSFRLRFSAEEETDVIKMEVCAPDRVLSMAYSNGADMVVEVPPGMDNKIWHLRPSIGSATRIITSGGPPYRYQDVPMSLSISGVPGYLSPTWEQWFDPENPVPPLERSDL